MIKCSIRILLSDHTYFEDILNSLLSQFVDVVRPANRVRGALNELYSAN